MRGFDKFLRLRLTVGPLWVGSVYIQFVCSMTMTKIAERIRRVKENIAAACERADRDPNEITLVVVTKSASFDAVKEVIRLGCRDFGENRVQQLRKVATQVEELQEQQGHTGPEHAVRWHMIGHLQRNKVRQALPVSWLIHSVDTLRLAEEVNVSAGKLGIKPDVMLQVNTSNEPQKYGAPVGAAIHLAEQLETLENMNLVGMMTMAPLTRNKDVIRACFVRARELFSEIRGERVVGPQFSQLSMGMSGDYEIAVEEGATILRIGSAIFAG